MTSGSAYLGYRRHRLQHPNTRVASFNAQHDRTTSRNRNGVLGHWSWWNCNLKQMSARLATGHGHYLKAHSMQMHAVSIWQRVVDSDFHISGIFGNVHNWHVVSTF